MFELEPIGHFVSAGAERYELPRQATVSAGSEGYVQLLPHCNYEQALADLEGFERIWVLFIFHRNPSWKPKVMPPRGGVKRGVFATRSPHRPNPIGMSCVELLSIEGLRVYTGAHDILDGSPIIDIKPYITYADSFPEARQGWLEGLDPEEIYDLQLAPAVAEQFAYLQDQWGIDILAAVRQRLTNRPLPYAGARITALGDEKYEIAYKSWRLRYSIDGKSVVIEALASAYAPEVLLGEDDPWGDLQIHKDFARVFHDCSGDI